MLMFSSSVVGVCSTANVGSITKIPVGEAAPNKHFAAKKPSNHIKEPGRRY